MGQPHFETRSYTVLDQRQDCYDSVVSPWMGWRCAQSFTPRVSGLLRFVDLNLEPEEHIGLGRARMYEILPACPEVHLMRLAESPLMPVTRGWNIFDFGNSLVAIAAGRHYALQFEPVSACDWRVSSTGKRYVGGVLIEQWGDGPWRAVSRTTDASFRTYVETFRSSASPSTL